MQVVPGLHALEDNKQNLESVGKLSDVTQADITWSQDGRPTRSYWGPRRARNGPPVASMSPNR
jgi:hypothetical protein